ncbi:MAG: DUF4118 domain-containing protein, partial [Pseudomonadota bacterium]
MSQRSSAKLKVFLGYAPGLGKTFKMLELARELAVEKVDLVIGFVETHGSYDTGSLVLGLEILPRRTVSYRGARLDELDLEAALARKPQVLIVDELAHTNAPGGRHAKRWQDVLDLLDAGIEVHTTLNVQELESLNDVVAQITGVRVRETVPDAVLGRADEIELVDCPPEELATRVAEGKVLIAEKYRRAAEPFLRRGSLLGLRELALRTVAQHVGEAVLEHREREAIRATWPTAERVMVCVGPAPSSAQLVRAASRMAASLHAPWIAAHVDSGILDATSQKDRDSLESHLGLAESLGGDVVRLVGGPTSQVVLDYARRRNVTRILVGKPTHSRWRDLLRGSFLEDLVRGSGDIDVEVISGAVAVLPQERAVELPPRQRPGLPAYGWTIGLVALATASGALARQHLAAPDFVMIYLLIIGVVAALFGRGPSLAASALSMLAYNYFFVP